MSTNSPKWFDGLKNLISGLGVESRDKGYSNRFALPILTAQDLTNAYRADWIAGKIVDIPAEDATREWRAWQAEKEEISAIEDTEKAFNVQGKVEEALKKARCFGGAGIVIGVRNANWSEPLEPSKLKKGDLHFLHVVDKISLTSGGVEWDVLSPNYGMPKYYQSGSSQTGAMNIHPSRVVRFIGRPYPRIELNSDGWGDSILLRVYQAVLDAALASQGVATLINEAAVDVIKMPDLMSRASTAEYKEQFTSRWTLAMLNKSINRAMILDKEEDYEKKQINFSNLPEVIKVYLNIAAGAGDIPATRLLGIAPQGLNATGDSDIRNYYDNVAANQKNKITPAMGILDQVIVANSVGSVQEEIFYDWRPLWQETEAEKTDNFLKLSQGTANLYNTGLVPDYALGKGLQNRLIEDGIYPGLEQAIEEAEDLGLDEDDDDVQQQFQQNKESGEVGNEGDIDTDE